MALKNHRFNRLNDCLILVYHIDDIAEYLSRFEHVTNNMAVLDLSFSEMAEVLKIKTPICSSSTFGHSYHKAIPSFAD